MAAAPARRKHGACLLRIKENCPLRKFKKNRCYGVDMEVVRPQAPITGVMSLPPSSVLDPGPLVPNLQPAYQHRRLPSTAPSEASMELDSGVDPETGEKAQR